METVWIPYPPVSNYIILKTTNGGSNWVQLTSGTNLGLYSIYFVDSNTGYAVGGDSFNGVVFMTVNGGNTWMTTMLDTYGDLRSVHFADANSGYAVGQNGTMVKTTNGGLSWTLQAPVTSDDLHSVFFADANTGYAIGWGGTTLKTTNGGVVGMNQHNPSIKNLKIYPNPVESDFIIELDHMTNFCRLSLFNINGEELMERQLIEPKTQTDISFWPPGVYFLRLIDDKTVRIGKLIKK